MEYKLGMVFGVAVSLTVGVLIVAVLFKKRVLDMTFDERQERARGQAFKLGFFTMMFCTAAYGISDAVLGRWIDVITGCMLCVCISVTVFAVECIRKDAYLSLKERPWQVMTLFAILAAVNLGIGALNLHSGEVVENGVLTFRAINPMVGVMMLLVLAIYAVKHLQDGSEMEEE